MKAIIYAGIGLFSVATAYGVADYYSSNKKGTLNELYAEEEAQPIVKTDEIKTTAIPVREIEAATPASEVVIPVVKSTKKEKRASKKINTKEFSRARIPEAVEIETEKEEPVLEKKEAVPAEIVMPKEENVRKISFEKFSRAPLKKPVKKITMKSKG
ncbi:MAG: hypothetical protein WBP16_01425 [Ferruginibacter sp.]